jgi:AraC-like DNA-binding protein
VGIVAPGAEIGRERAARHVPRHPHLAPYAALVLRGGYVEAGDRGRFRAEPGDVLLHDRFEAHQDHFGRRGADILNLALESIPALAFARAADPDGVVRLAERDPCAAAALLRTTLAPRPAADDWPDRLAAELRADRVGRLDAWADAAGLRPQSVSRGFRLCYGVTPQRYRVEQRAARAARAILMTRSGLACISAEASFADQPHMSRTIRRLYATSPAALRRVQCVQDPDRAPA